MTNTTLRRITVAGSGLFFIVCVLRFLWPIAGPEAWSPRLACDGPVFNFGSAPSGSPVRHRFRIRNTGWRPLHIKRWVSNIRLDEHRFRSDLASATIAPRAVVDFPLEICFPPQSKGAVSAWVLLESNDPYQPTFKLTFRGVAVPQVAVLPQKLLFGTVGDAGAPAQSVEIRSEAGVKFHITRTETSSPHFAAVCQCVEEGIAYRIHVEPVGLLPEGPVWATLQIGTDHEWQPELTVPLFAFGERNVANAGEPLDASRP